MKVPSSTMVSQKETFRSEDMPNKPEMKSQGQIFPKLKMNTCVKSMRKSTTGITVKIAKRLYALNVYLLIKATPLSLATCNVRISNKLICSIIVKDAKSSQMVDFKQSIQSRLNWCSEQVQKLKNDKKSLKNDHKEEIKKLKFAFQRIRDYMDT